MKARIVKWLIANEPAITWIAVFVAALALMGQLDGLVM